MKKIYISLAALLTACTAFAQNQVNEGAAINLRTPNHVPVKHTPTPQATNSFYIDYDYADEQLWGTGSYQRFIWDINMNYSKAAGDTLNSQLNYAVVAFDSLHDPYSMLTIPNNAVTSITIDSIFAVLGHENNSGTDDTLIVKIISLSAQGYPQSTVLWSDTMIISASSPLSGTANDWLSATTVSWNPAFTTTNKRFGVRLDYRGDKTDTLGVLAGFGDNGPCGQSSVSAFRSNFAVNSYTQWVKYSQYGLLPTSTGADIFYDCDSDGQYTEGVDGATYLQNISVWTYVTIVDNVSIEETSENGVALSQNKPNPANDNTVIGYSIVEPANVALNVYDITGKLVLNVNEGKKAAGKHAVTINTSSLPAGIYYYSLSAGEKTITKKMVVMD